MTTPHRRAADGPESQRRALLSLIALGGLLAAVPGLFLLWRFPEGGMLDGLSSQLLALACASGLLTALLLSPLWWLLRRLHPAAEQGRWQTAGWSVTGSLVMILAAWLVFDRLTRTPWIDDAVAPWLAVALALLMGLPPISWPQPSKGLRWTAIALTPLALLGTVVAFWSTPTSTSSKAKVRPSDGGPRPDIVLVTVDTLRADRLAAYGGRAGLTPALDRAASEGVLFQRPVASSPWTMPSIASLMTSVSSLEHGAGRPVAPGPTFLRTPLSEDWTVLAERLAAAGYRTRAVVNNAFLSPERGFAQGFEAYETPLLDSSRATFLAEVPLGRLLLHLLPLEALGDPRAAAVTDRALQWLADDDPAPLFLWLHYIDPHAPYRAHPEALQRISMLEELEASPKAADDGTVVGQFFVAAHWIRGGLVWLSQEDRRRLEAFYDGAVRYTDLHLGRLFDALRQRQVQRPTLVAFTADHGEEFWDHGHFEHGHDYYHEVTRVPLFFWAPGLLPAGRTVDEPVGLVDIAPTLLDLIGVPGPEADSWDDGLSLVPGWQAETFDLPPRDSGGNLYNYPAVLIEEGPWRAILRAQGQLELYHVPSDPLERRDVALLQPETAAVFRKILQPRLDAFMVAAGEDADGLSAEDMEGLRSLGYVQ